MQRRFWALLCALCLLAGCGQQGGAPPPTAEELPEAVQEVQPEAGEVPEEMLPERAEEASALQTAPPAFPEGFCPLPERELRPYEAWTFAPEPYLVTVEEYGELFSLRELTWEYDDARENLIEYGRDLDTPYTWYGVPEMFPFIGIGEAGLMPGGWHYENGMPVSCDKASAMAERFYSMAVEYDSPDGTPWVRQESNYPQFCSWKLSDYRWDWDGSGGDRPFAPKQPEPYREAIALQAAELNRIFLERFSSDTYYDPYGDNDLPLTELTDAQNAWLTEQWIEERRFIEEYQRENGVGLQGGDYDIPESDRCYAATGLTILNGDSRTEETYFAAGRAKDICITVNGTYAKEITLADTPAPQLVSLDYVQPTIAKPLDITVEVLSSYPGAAEEVYLTEIGVGLTSNLPQGR